MDARALAMQLRSPFGQKILSGINSASTIPLIQLRELLRLQILIPDGETIQRAADALNQEAQLQLEIDRLYQQQSEVAKNLWPL
jgi:restriction endonuclease S subunit